MHEDDVADVAVLALTADGHTGRAYTLCGGELLSRREQVSLIADAVAEPVTLTVVTPEEARADYRALGGFAAENADFLLGFTDYGGRPTDPQEVAATDLSSMVGRMPTAEAVTGRPARTFGQWALDHRADFL